MVAFNPDNGGIASSGIPDLTGVSRGATPNRAFETLFSGIGDVVGGAANVIDTTIKTGIKDEVQKGYESLNQPLNNIPPELANSTQGMQALQTAYEQGKISDTYYYGTLNSQLKGLRTKYPGYEDFIDETMQSVTGVRPANAFRNAILSEIASAQSSATDTEKAWATWEKQNEADIARVFPDYFENPGKYDRDMVRARTVQLKADEAGIIAEGQRIDFMSKQDTLTEEAATESATTALIQTANTFLSGQSNALGFDGADFMTRIANMTADGYSPEDYTQLVSQMTIAENQLKQNLLQLTQQPLAEGSSNSYASVIGDPTKVNALVDQAMARFSSIKQMVIDKDFGMAGYYTRMNDLRTQKGISTILDASPELATYTSLAKVNPDLAQVWLMEGGNQDSALNAITPELMARVATGDDSFNAAMDRIDTSTFTPVEKSSAANSMIDVALSTITSGNASGEQLAQSVASIYALDKDGRDVFNMVTPDQYATLYSRMFNPTVTAALAKSGDTQSLQTYYEAARERLTAIPDFRRIAATVQDQVDWQKGISVDFDPKSGRLSVVADQSASNFAKGPLTDIGFRNLVRSANESVTQLNNVFSTIQPMLDGLGVDKGLQAGVFQEILKDLNVDVENGKQDGFFDWVGDQVQNELDIFMNSDATKAITSTVQSELMGTSNALFADAYSPEEQTAMKQDFKFDFLNQQAAQGIQYDTSMINQIDFELDGKVRNKPTSDMWNGTVSSILSDMPRGIGVVVTSGGQDASGPHRTGSHRHDVNENGESDTADVVLTQNGKKVTPSEAPELYADFLRRAAYMGFEGIGHYSWGVHIGMGSRAAWGPSKTSSDLDPMFAAAIQEGWNQR